MPDQTQEYWVTYAEAGKLLGISAQAARMLAKRRGWPRRTPNAYGDRALVQVPADVIVQPRAASLDVRTGYVVDGDQAKPNGHDQVNVQALEGAVEALREQLGILNRQIDEERALTADERKRADAERARADRERDRADWAEQRFAALLAQQRVPRRWWQWRR